MGKERKDRKSRSRDDDDDSRKKRKKRSRSDDVSDDGNRHRRRKKAPDSRSDDDGSDRDRHRRREKKRRKKSSVRKRQRSSKHKKKKRSYSSSSDAESSESGEEGKKVINERLLAKLEARGETLEERNERRAQKRAAQLASKFGYTADENPFRDPNLHEKFTWKKREESRPKISEASAKNTAAFYEEIEKVRQRRKDRDLQREEMERIRAEESRMKELENYDEWAKKEEEFHLQQQRQRSAIRLVEGREKPVDVLAKNLLLFGLSDEEKKNRASVKYQEKYNAMNALEELEVELEEPQNLLKVLKLAELEELRGDIAAFRTLEREASSYGTSTSDSNPVLLYWDALALVVNDEIKLLHSGGEKSAHGKMVADVAKIFGGRSIPDLITMKEEVHAKLKTGAGSLDVDNNYWQTVADQLAVHLAKATLSEMHGKMLVRQLDRLDKKREELARQPEETEDDSKLAPGEGGDEEPQPESAPPLEGGDLENELGLTSEVDVAANKAYSWQHKYAPRRPRYYNRVKLGYDWNAYNKTHYDRDNPPPKVVQGYKFNIFYTDLVNPLETPQYKLEPADSDEFCIIRFHAGAPYEDIAFKIVNREWNRSRKRGFRSTFERGVLSLYFNFTTHWYRR